MTETDHWELNAFIAEYVMGWAKVPSVVQIERGNFFVGEDGQVLIHAGLNRVEIFDPVWNDAQAMMVLEKCLKHPRPHGGVVLYDSQISPFPCFTVASQSIGNLRQQAGTLPLAICKFAKQLFSTPDSPRPPAAPSPRPPSPRD